MDINEWEAQETEREAATVLQGIARNAGKIPFPSTLHTDYDDAGKIVVLDRHYGGARHDELDHEARTKAGKGPLRQSALVYMAVSKNGITPGEVTLKSRSATCSLPIATAAGTGFVLRVLVPVGTIVEAAPIRDGEPPTEEVILPEGARLRVYDCSRVKNADAKVVDARLVV